MNKNVFFGAGKIGQSVLKKWSFFDIAPDCFVDNNPVLWGTSLEGIPVISLDSVEKIDDTFFWITCKDESVVREQLLMTGVCQENIKNSNGYFDICDMIAHKYAKLYKSGQNERNKYNATSKRVIFDLECGLVLGGVESWSFEMADRLKKQGWNACFLTNNQQKHIIKVNDNALVMLDYMDEAIHAEKLGKCIQTILNMAPCNIICNFPFTTFEAACIAKRILPEAINVVAVIHNDEQIYYDKYCLWHDYIDYLLIISDKMERRVREHFADERKIYRLEWLVPCAETLHRTYSEPMGPLKIGYAGRVSVIQKRMDLLVKIMSELSKAAVKFILEIAGSGDYKDEMERQIKELGLEDSVVFLGKISRDSIGEFWKRQDLAISCSDFEGRSISKAEAMASGAVPIVSDTSGMRDDIIDGWNGYVLKCGSWEPFVKTISSLSKDRKKIEDMGRNAHHTILKNNEKYMKSDLWERVLI